MIERDDPRTKIRKVRCVDPAGAFFVKGMIYTQVESPGRVWIYSNSGSIAAKPGTLNLLGMWSTEGYDMYHRKRFVEIDESRNLVLEKFRHMERIREEAERWIDEFIAI